MNRKIFALLLAGNMVFTGGSLTAASEETIAAKNVSETELASEITDASMDETQETADQEETVQETAGQEETVQETADQEETVQEAANEDQTAQDVHNKVATKEEMTDIEEVIEDWMTPIYAEELKNGSYETAVNCSSSMFSIEKAVLTVEDGQMSAVLTMGGTAYLYVYPGTAEEAAQAPEEDYIPYEEDEEGRYTFTIPVEALDAPVPCAAYSRRKEKWYERTLAFVSTSLPADAFVKARGTTAEDLALEDGTYTVDATLAGGSGRATIESPAVLTVEEGSMTLQVIFSSPNYDYMLVNGDRYEPVNTEGNSTFLIPVSALDTQIPVIADTIAMSKPHEIDYTIYLDSATLNPESSL